MVEGKEGAWNIQAYNSDTDVMKAFTGYTQAWRRSAESAASACLGMMNMQPVAISCPEKVEDLTPFIVERKLVHVSGGAIGRGYYGMPVSADILKFKQFEVWDQSMKAAGVK